MARNEQLIRQHKILQILERVRFGKTMEEIQAEIIEELGLTSVSTRTLRRDLEALQAAGIDIQTEDTQRGKIWKFGPLAKSTTKIAFTSTELIALSLGHELLHPLAGTPFWQGIESSWNKIQEAVPASVFEHFQKIRKILRVTGMSAKSYEKHHGFIKTFLRAIVEHRVVEIEYEKPGDEKQLRSVEPYSLTLDESSLYVFGAAVEVQAPESRLRSYKLDRVSKATITDTYFKEPEELDLDQIFEHTTEMFVRPNSSSDYKIRVNKTAAAWVREDPINPDQQLHELADGSFELTVAASHETAIIIRVLSMGQHAEIIAPESVREAMAKIVNQMAGKYK